MPQSFFSDDVEINASITAVFAGDVAHDSPDSGNPVKIGGIGTDTIPPSVDGNDRVNASFTRSGLQRVVSFGDVAHDDAYPTGPNAGAVRLAGYATADISALSSVSEADVSRLVAGLKGDLLMSLATALNVTKDSVLSTPGLSNSSVAGSTPYASSALEASSVVLGTSGNLYSVLGRVDSTLASGTVYLQFLNYTALPSNGAVTMLDIAPIKIQHVNGFDTNFSIEFPAGVYCSTGCVIALSTTEFTLTIGSAYLSITAVKA